MDLHTERHPQAFYLKQKIRKCWLRMHLSRGMCMLVRDFVPCMGKLTILTLFPYMGKLTLLISLVMFSQLCTLWGIPVGN